MRPLANLREGSLLMSVSPLKACPFNAGIVCVSTAIVSGRRGRPPTRVYCRRLKKAAGMSRHFVSAPPRRHVRRVPPDVCRVRRSLMVSLASLAPSEKLNRARKTPWKLSVTRKANARARLKKVDAVIDTVRASGVQCRALVSIAPPRLYTLLFRPRTAPCSCPRNTKWSQKINTPSSARRHAGIERVFTRCPNGQGYVPMSHWWNLFSQSHSKADAKGQPERLLALSLCYFYLHGRESVGHAIVASMDNH